MTSLGPLGWMFALAVFVAAISAQTPEEIGECFRPTGLSDAKRDGLARAAVALVTADPGVLETWHRDVEAALRGVPANTATRRAAVRVLAAAGGDVRTLTTLFTNAQVSPDTRIACTPVIPSPELRRAVLDRGCDDSVRLAALSTLAPEEDPWRVLSVADWSRLLSVDGDPVAARAVSVLVHSRAAVTLEFCRELLLHPVARRRLLEAFQDRPRVCAAEFARAVLALEDDASRLDRVLAISFLTPGEVSSDRAQDVLAALLGGGPGGSRARAAALRAVQSLGAQHARLVVADVHRALVTAPDDPSAARVWHDLQPALRCVDKQLARTFSGLVRLVGPRTRLAMLEWLEHGAPLVVRGVVGDMLDGDLALEPGVLEFVESGDLTLSGRVDRLLDGVRDAKDSRLALLGFRALARSSSVANELLLDEIERSPEAVDRVRTYLDSRGVPAVAGDLVRLLRVRGGARSLVRKLAETEGRLDVVVAGALQTSLEDGLLAVEAVSSVRHLLLHRASSEIAAACWRSIPLGERCAFAGSFGRRDNALVRELLEDVTVTGEREHQRLAMARLRAGDASVIDDLLADPGAWPDRFLRDVRDDVLSVGISHLQRARMVDIAESTSLDLERRARFVDWLGLCGGEESRVALRRIHATTPVAGDLSPVDLRQRALSALLRFPNERVEFRRRVLAQVVGTGRTDDCEVLAFDVLGAERLPLQDDVVEMVAEVLFAPPPVGVYALAGPSRGFVTAAVRALARGGVSLAGAAHLERCAREAVDAPWAIHADVSRYGGVDARAVAEPGHRCGVCLASCAVGLEQP